MALEGARNFYEPDRYLAVLSCSGQPDYTSCRSGPAIGCCRAGACMFDAESSRKCYAVGRRQYGSRGSDFYGEYRY